MVKYNTKAAEAFRDKISAAAEGRPWVCPKDIPMGTAPAPVAPRTTSSGNMHRSGSNNSFSNNDDWGWDDDNGGGGGSNLARSASTPQVHRPGEEYTMADLQASAADKEAYFARQQARNASKPEVRAVQVESTSVESTSVESTLVSSHLLSTDVRSFKIVVSNVSLHPLHLGGQAIRGRQVRRLWVGRSPPAEGRRYGCSVGQPHQRWGRCKAKLDTGLKAHPVSKFDREEGITVLST